MKRLLDELDQWRRDGERIALATVVQVRGAAPRQPGARLGVSRDGRMSGSVSAGCVENDVFLRACTVIDEGRASMASYGITDEMSLGVGLSCGGSIDVLIEPYEDSPVWQALRDALESYRPVAIASGVEPAALRGRRLAVMREGETIGSIDPALDAQLAQEARRLLPRGGTRLIRLGRHDEDAVVFVEAFAPPRTLFIVGATDTGVALCRGAKRLGYRVVIIDPREVYASRRRLPEADRLLCTWPDEALDEEPLDAGSYVVTLIHDPKFDLPTLARALRSEARYIGALGSRRTHGRRVAQLIDEGFTETDLARIHAPIGLDLGGDDAEEIALAILSEMQAVRYGKSATSLRDRDGEIHPERRIEDRRQC